MFGSSYNTPCKSRAIFQGSTSILLVAIFTCLWAVSLRSEQTIPADTINYAAQLPPPTNSTTKQPPDSRISPGGPVVRIQLLTSTSFASARMASRVAQELFGESVSVDFESPNFKVRLGRFESAAEAQPMLERARQAGFANPLVVTQSLMQRADSSNVPVSNETVSPR